MSALETASVGKDIVPFTQFLGSLVRNKHWKNPVLHTRPMRVNSLIKHKSSAARRLTQLTSTVVGKSLITKGLKVWRRWPNCRSTADTPLKFQTIFPCSIDPFPLNKEISSEIVDL